MTELIKENGYFFTDISVEDFIDDSYQSLSIPGPGETQVLYGNTTFTSDEYDGWDPAKIIEVSLSELEDVVAGGFDVLNLNDFGFNGENLTALLAADFFPCIVEELIFNRVDTYEDSLVVLNNFSYSDGKLVSYDETIKATGDVFRYTITEVDIVDPIRIGTPDDYNNFAITGTVEVDDVPNSDIKDYDVTVTQIV